MPGLSERDLEQAVGMAEFMSVRTAQRATINGGMGVLSSVFKTVPNQLAGLRLLLVPVLWVPALEGMAFWVGIGLIITGLTDCLDGFLARRFNQVTAFGSRLDSLADNLLIPSILVWVLMLRPRIFWDHPSPFTALVLLYVLSVLIGWLKFGRFANLHLYSSKAAGVLGYAFVVHALLSTYHVGLFYVTIGAFILASAEEIVILLTRSRVDERIGSIIKGRC